ncbi:MAG: hypothetical protein ACFB0D_14555 [Phormidesmis sp.]
MSPSLKRYRLLGMQVTTLFSLLILLGVALQSFQSALAQPAPIRRFSPSTISAQIYQQLPDFPLENQYISSETGSVDPDNTLVSRFVRYHVYIQNRPTNFRLDWKLTLADYLGAFERMSSERYADYGLRENPLNNDIAVIEALSPEQRNTFVNTLYETFTAPIEEAEPAAEDFSAP